MVSGFGEILGGNDVELAFVFKESVGVELCDLCWGFAFGDCGSDDFVATLFQDLLSHVANISDVLDVYNFAAVDLKGAPYPVCHEV